MEEGWFLFHCVPEPKSVDAITKAVSELFPDLDSSTIQIQNLKSSQNFTYKITVPSGPFIARLTPDVHQKPDLIQTELKFLEYLSNNGVSVCKSLYPPVEVLMDNVKFCLAFFQYAEGKNPMDLGFGWLSQKTPRVEHFLQDWGKWMGLLHNVSSTLAPADFPRPQWDQVHNNILARAKEVLIEPEDAKAAAEWNQLEGWARSLPTTADRFGLIHGDLNVSNFFVREMDETTMKGLHVFDWDQLQYGWYAYDVAVIGWMLVYLQNTMPDCKDLDYDWFLQNFLIGYQTERTLAPEEIEWIPKFVSIRKLFYVIFCVKTVRDAKAYPKLNVPAFFPQLAQSIIDYYNSH